MKIIGLNEITLKEKKELVHNACLLYKKLNLYKEFVQQKLENNISDRIEDVNRKTFRSASLFETLLNMLTDEQRMVIENNFIKNSKENWWEKKWSKATYYKIFNEAIDNFLFLFYA